MGDDGVVSLGTVKAYLRIGAGDEDALIEALIAVAQGLCAAFLGTTLAEASAGGALPAPIAQGIVRLVAHLHAHRDAIGADGAGAGPPAAVAALWRPYRRVRL